jgi:CheY-like chemotaxis protein
LVIVALSGYGQDEHRRQSREAGCDDHFVKPVRPDVLRSFLGRLGHRGV